MFGRNTKGVSAISALAVAAGVIGLSAPAVAANYSFSVNMTADDLRCGYFVTSFTCATAVAVPDGPIASALAGDTFNLTILLDQAIRVPGSQLRSLVFAGIYDQTATLGSPQGGPYQTNGQLILNGYQGPGGLFQGQLQQQVQSGYQGVAGVFRANPGFSFTGATAQLTALTNAIRPLDRIVVGFAANLPDAPEVIEGLQGGTPNAPVILPPGLVGQVTANIGGDFGADQYYGFGWNGGVFQTGAQVLNAPSDAIFKFRLLDNQYQLLRELELNEANAFDALLTIGDLAAGSYVIGISQLGNVFPAFGDAAFAFGAGSEAAANDGARFKLSFASPVGSVPEPSTWVSMIVGFGLSGAAVRRRTKGLHPSAARA